MCKTQTQQYIYELHLAKSRKQCLRPLVNEYNQGRPLRQRLRSAHIKLAEHLLNLYFARLKSAQGPGRLVLVPGQPLPTLRTSNGALAKEMGVTSRTIMNLRERLAQAGIIAAGAWHGTNSSYELHLNPLALHLQTRQIHQNQNALFFAIQWKTFRHIETGNLLQDTNKALLESGADVENTATQAAPDTREAAATSVPVTKKAAPTSTPDTEQTGYETDENPTTARGPEPAPPSCAAPPRQQPAETLPALLEEATGHLAPKDRNEVERIGRSIWAYAHAELYGDKWLSHSVCWEAQVALTEYLAWWVKPGHFEKARLIVMRRIDMVRNWLDRDPTRRKAALGSIESTPAERWIPLPNHYFDMRNEHGFHRTQEWYNRRQRKIAQAKRKEALTRAVNQYGKSLLPGAPYGPDQAYRTLSQKLRKQYGNNIIREFQERLAQLKAA